MPIYEYHCGTCEADFEMLVTARTQVQCPSCESADVERLLSVFGMKSGNTFVASTGRS